MVSAMHMLIVPLLSLGSFRFQDNDDLLLQKSESMSPFDTYFF